MDNRYEEVSEFYSSYTGTVPSLKSYFDEAVEALTVQGMNTFGRESQMILVAGIPGSGKSTYIHNNFNLNEYFLIGIDSVREWFLKNSLVPQVSWLNATESSGFYQLLFFEISEKVIHNLMSKNVNIIIDTTFRSYINGMAQANKVAIYGYDCHVVYLDVDIATATERVIARYYDDIAVAGEGRVIPINDYTNFMSYSGEEKSVAGDIFVEVHDMYSDSFNSFSRI